jgi:hypothetical protein
LKGKPVKHRITTLLLAFAVAVSGALFVAAPSASADGLDNSSGTLTVECPGAKAFIQFDWNTADRVDVRWYVEDTGTATNISPVLRIQARDHDGTEAPFIFPSGDTFFVLRGGNGHSEVGVKHDWNPGNMVNINHLRVKVQNGTTEQGTSCIQERNAYNWTMIAHKNAVSKEGADYLWGGTGPAYDCSGLVYTSYNAVGNFPGFGNVRSAQQMYDWARTHTEPAKQYAMQVPVSELKVGDLLFYENTIVSTSRITHVAFWEENDNRFDAISSGVGYHANSSWWDSRFVVAYRVLGVATV